jgi:hypothetical protein
MSNSATTFAQSVVENFQTVFLGQGHFDEALVYRPKSGAARTLRGVVQYSRRFDQGQDGTSLIEELTVLVARDPACDAGGIDDPQIGDAIRRGADEDQNAWYGWAGETPEGNAAGWTLKFTRRRPFQMGRQQTQT